MRQRGTILSDFPARFPRSSSGAVAPDRLPRLTMTVRTFRGFHIQFDRFARLSSRPPRRRNGPARPSSASCCRAATPSPPPPTPSSISRTRRTSGCNTFYAGALYGDNGEFTNAERYEARYQLDYKINDRLSWFGALRGEKDNFSGFVYQATVSTGATYKFIDNPDHQVRRLARRRLSALAGRSADQDAMRAKSSIASKARRRAIRWSRWVRRTNTPSPRTPRSPTSSWRSPGRTTPRCRTTWRCR